MHELRGGLLTLGLGKAMYLCNHLRIRLCSFFEDFSLAHHVLVQIHSLSSYLPFQAIHSAEETVQILPHVVCIDG